MGTSNDHPESPWQRMARRFRHRSTRDLHNLDERGRLGDPPNALPLAIFTFILATALAFLTFVTGRSDGTVVVLLIMTIGIFGLAVAIGVAMMAAQYRTQQQLGAATAELLTVHAELKLTREDTSHCLHDAKALTAAIGATVHTLKLSGADPGLTDPILEQLAQLAASLNPLRVTVAPILLGELLEPVRSVAAAHGLDLLIDLDPDVEILADANTGSRVLINLIDNTRKYAPGSSVTITTRPSGPFIQVLTDDDGPGIEGGDPEAIFTPGLRKGVDAQGVGMGLASARRMAEDMGGALWYEPKPGGGSRFVLKLATPDRTSGPECGYR